MKKKILLPVMALAMMVTAGVNVANNSNNRSNRLFLGDLTKVAFAFAEEAGYSCSVSSNCFMGFGTVEGSVTCTGVNSCERGYEWVKCDGNKTECD